MNSWIGRLAALGIGVVLLLLLEGALYFWPSLAPPPLVLELAQWQGEELCTINPAFPQRFFQGHIGSTRLEGMRMTPHPFIDPKGEKAFRVVFAGGSTVQGFPHPRRLTANAYLQAMLQDAWPERKVEVFNAGITAVASFAVARTVEEAMALSPDLVVVYTGHNELYGVYGAASLRQGGEGIWSKRLYYFLMQRRLSMLMSRMIEGIETVEKRQDRSLLEVMAHAGSISPEDPRRQEAERNLRQNLQEIVSSCRSRDIPLILCTLVANERGFTPAGAELPETLSDGRRREWREGVMEGQRLLDEEGDGAAALEYLDRAERIYAEHALLQFYRGRALELRGEGERAREAFGKARDLDPRPWRAPESYNEIIRDLAAREGVLLADISVAFHRASPSAGVGWELMADHLHPSTPGQLLLARTVVGALHEGDPAIRVGEKERRRLRSDEEYRRLMGDLPVERLAVRRSMAALLSEPPMDRGNEGHVVQLRQEAERIWQGLVPGEKRGVERWREGKGPELLVLNVADQLFAQRAFDRAREYYRAARCEEPYTPWGDVWATLRWGRCLEVMRGRLDEEAKREIEALLVRFDFLSRVPGSEPGIEGFFNGYAFHLLDRREESVEQMLKAVGDETVRRSFSFDLLSLLCEDLIALGRFEQAEEIVRLVTGESGQAEFGRFLLQQIQARRNGNR